MTVVVLDANAVIGHGRAFPARARAAHGRGLVLVLPQSVKAELVDDVLDNPQAPPNHRDSARAIQALVEDGVLDVRSPDFEQDADVIDEARRRIADESLPEHQVRADQYIPAIVCACAADGPVTLVTGDRKLRTTVSEIAATRGLDDQITLADPGTVL